MQKIPIDLLEAIMLMLEPKDIFSFFTTCRQFHQLSERESLWQSLGQKYYPNIYFDQTNKSFDYKILFQKYYEPKFEYFCAQINVDDEISDSFKVAQVNLFYELVNIFNKNIYKEGKVIVASE